MHARRTPSWRCIVAQCTRWWADSAGVALLASIAAIESHAMGAPGASVAAMVCLGGAYVLARATARMEYRRGWVHGHAAGMDTQHSSESGLPSLTRLRPPEPWSNAAPKRAG